MHTVTVMIRARLNGKYPYRPNKVSLSRVHWGWIVSHATRFCYHPLFLFNHYWRWVGKVSEKSILRQQARLVRRAKTSRRDFADLGGACAGGKFVVWGAAEAYDARAKGPNRKFRFDPQLVKECK